MSTELHKDIANLEWLVGKWNGTDGKGRYPNIQEFGYGEDIEFSHCGQPNIQFSAYSWNTETKKPMHREVGFLKPKSGTNQMALIIAQNTGLSEIEEGEFNEDTTTLTFSSKSVGRISFGKDPVVQKVKREFKLTGNVVLTQTISMETDKTPMTEHLKITYTKCW